MLRKLASALAVAFVVTLAFASTATASPYDPAAVDATRDAGGNVDIRGFNFGDTVADDFVTVTVLVNGVATTYQFALDEDGNFAGEIPGVGDAAATVTIVGNNSGETRTVQIAGVGQSTAPTTTAVVTSTIEVPTTIAVPTTINGVPSTAYVPSTATSVVTIGGSSGYSGGSGSSGGGYYSSGSGSSGGSQGAYNSDYAATGGYSSGSSLASTGASIAGPMAIGLATLTVGLGLLFFGTRGVIRRKGARQPGN